MRTHVFFLSLAGCSSIDKQPELLLQESLPGCHRLLFGGKAPLHDALVTDRYLGNDVTCAAAPPAGSLQQASRRGAAAASTTDGTICAMLASSTDAVYIRCGTFHQIEAWYPTHPQLCNMASVSCGQACESSL